MDELLPIKVSSTKELNEIDKKFNIEFESKWKFIIGYKITYPGYHCIYQEENGNYIICYNNPDGTPEKLFIGNNEAKAINVFWTIFLDKVYKSNDILKEKIPHKVIKKNYPSRRKKVIMTMLLFIIGLAVQCICLKIGGLKYIEYMIRADTTRFK